MYNQYREGWLEVICGCMFAGKTEELIRRINVLSFAKKNIIVFKPKLIIVIRKQKLFHMLEQEFLVLWLMILKKF